MTDKHAGYVVVLAEELREDDAEPTLNAIRQLKNVASVTPIQSSFDIELAEQRARNKIWAKLTKAVWG